MTIAGATQSSTEKLDFGGNAKSRIGQDVEAVHKSVIRDWFERNISGDEKSTRDYGPYVTTGFGVAGAATGGYLAHRSVENDTILIKDVFDKVPKAEYYDVTDYGKRLSRTDLRILNEFVKANTGGVAEEAGRDLKYITYLAATNPDESAVIWGNIYEGVKLHSSSGQEARQTMQVLTAILQKNPDAPPQQVYMEYISRINKLGATSRALESMKADFKIQESDYTETIIGLKAEHTSWLWKLGEVGATLAGIITGAAIGVGIGAIATAISKIIFSNSPAPEREGKS